MSPEWLLIQRIVALLGDDDGLLAIEIGERIGIPAAYARQAAEVLYRQHNLVFVLGYLVAASAEGRPAA